MGKILLLLLFLFSFLCAQPTKMFFDFYGFKKTSDNDILTIPCEALPFLQGKDYNLDPEVSSPLGYKTGITIKYIPYGGYLYRYDKLVFRLTNGKISPNISKCWLVFHEYKGIDNNFDGVGEESIDLNQNYSLFDILTVAESINNVADNDEIVFRVTKRTPPNAVLFLACSEDNEPFLYDKLGYYFDGFDTSYNPVIKINTNLSSNSIYNRCDVALRKREICFTVSAYSCCSEEEIDSISIRKPQCFMDIQCQFSVGMRPALSIIDVYKNLNNPTCTNSKSGIVRCFLNGGTYSFMEEYSGDILTSKSCTDKYASGSSIFIKENPFVDEPIVLGKDGWTGKLKLQMYDIRNIYACSDKNEGNLLGYKALDFSNGRVFLDNNGKSYGSLSFGDVEDRIHFQKGKKCFLEADVYSDDSCDEDSSTICLRNKEWEDDIYIGIKGDIRLSSIQWGLTEIFDIYKDGTKVFSIKMDEKADCFKEKCCYDKGSQHYFLFWKSNGDEAFVPYMLNMNRFRIAVSNNSCWDAEIYARVWDEKGRVADDVYLGKIKANSVKILFGDRIIKAAKKLNPNLLRGTSPLFSMILSVGAPKRDIEFAAYDNRENKTKMIPIYDLSGEEWTYKNVEFTSDPF